MNARLTRFIKHQAKVTTSFTGKKVLDPKVTIGFKLANSDEYHNARYQAEKADRSDF